MNKSAIIGFILNKKTTSKRGEKVFGELYMMKQTARPAPRDSRFSLEANDNAFWADDNESRRLELINDIESISYDIAHGFNRLDAGFLKIVDRYEHGDRYGIEPKIPR